MDHLNDWYGYDSMAIFGRVNALISHELKNVMAIISETAGLLSDLSAVASSDAPVTPEMLKSCTDSILEEVQRGYAIIRQMNRLSHSIDKPVGIANLQDIVDLSINLAEYVSFSGNTTLERAAGEPPTVQTCPFLLQAVVYQTLIETYKNGGKNVQIHISICPRRRSGWRIRFSGLNVSRLSVFPDPVIALISDSIGVTIHRDSTAGLLDVVVPATMQRGSADDNSVEAQKANHKS